MDSVRFYFSFRSPYSWLGFHRIERALAGLPVRLNPIPCFPPPGSMDEDPAVRVEDRYIRDDVGRFAHAYGLDLRRPEPFDTDWIGCRYSRLPGSKTEAFPPEKRENCRFECANRHF